MSCDRSRTVVHGYLDGELDAVRAAEFERHLEDCAECVTELEAQEALRASLQKARIYEKAPNALRENVLAEAGASARAAAPSRLLTLPRRDWRTVRVWLAAVAAIVLGVYAGWYMRTTLRTNGAEQVLAAQIVDAHLRALQPGHLADVISTDQHTVKPWFDGRLDFSPPVRDFADEGFPLQGGRLDVVSGRSVAVLVYGHRKHVINVFVWPAPQQEPQDISGERLGYQWMEWHKDGMEMWMVSDLNAAELSELRRLLMKD